MDAGAGGTEKGVLGITRALQASNRIMLTNSAFTNMHVDINPKCLNVFAHIPSLLSNWDLFNIRFITAKLALY